MSSAEKIVVPARGGTEKYGQAAPKAASQLKPITAKVKSKTVSSNGQKR